MKKVVQHFYIQMGMGSGLSHRVLIYVAPTVCVLCFIWGGGGDKGCWSYKGVKGRGILFQGILVHFARSNFISGKRVLILATTL